MILHHIDSRLVSRKDLNTIIGQGIRCSRNSSTTAMSSKVRSHVDRSHGNFLYQRRRNLSGVNPMFAERAIPDKHKISEEADFLTRHGGKIAVVALSITFFLVYTYYESGQSKNRVEEELNDEAAIEPYEVNG